MDSVSRKLLAGYAAADETEKAATLWLQLEKQLEKQQQQRVDASADTIEASALQLQRLLPDKLPQRCASLAYRMDSDSRKLLAGYAAADDIEKAATLWLQLDKPPKRAHRTGAVKRGVAGLASSFHCRFPGCKNAYASPDAVRKHCRQDPAHALWLQGLGAKQDVASYCSWIPEQESTAKPQKLSAPPKKAPPKKAPSGAKRAREQENFFSQMDR